MLYPRKRNDKIIANWNFQNVNFGKELWRISTINVEVYQTDYNLINLVILKYLGFQVFSWFEFEMEPQSYHENVHGDNFINGEFQIVLAYLS